MGESIPNTAAAIRYGSAIAASCGLQVSIEMTRCPSIDSNQEIPCPVWRGTAEQFLRLWFLAPGDARFVEMKRYRWFHPAWLRGHLYREGPDAYRFVIESGWLSKQMENRIYRRAPATAGFLRFIERLIEPVELDSGGGSEP